MTFQNMTFLQTCYVIAKALQVRPIQFWDPRIKKELLKEAYTASLGLIYILEKKNLKDTYVYNQLSIFKKIVAEENIDEVAFVRVFDNLINVYRQSPPDEGLVELLDMISPMVSKAKQRANEYHFALEKIRKRGKKMSKKEQLQSDQKTIQKIGLFYVLEYTLQVLYEFTRISDDDKKKLLDEGLKNDVGNLPAYRLLEDSFRKELCYKVFDDVFRSEILVAFYKFEKVFYREDLKAIAVALKEFNLSLIKAFQAKGLTKFKGIAYYPFGNDLTIAELIKKVEAVQV